MKLNEQSLDTLCAALAHITGVDAPAEAAAPAPALMDYAREALHGRKADRLFMYNPDAIGQWLYEKYPEFFSEVKALTGIEMPFQTVMPSVTPVCFGTMYTGAQPAVHGIRRYEKPVIRIDTLFDAMIRAGKKLALLADTDCSMSLIFLERDMDYFIYDSIAEINAKAAELIIEDKYDAIFCYNTNYDSTMHKNGPEAPISLAEMRANAHAFAQFMELIKTHWRHHDTFVGFAMDHGCHEIDGGCGAHGLDMEEDLNIVHLYGAYPAEK